MNEPELKKCPCCGAMAKLDDTKTCKIIDAIFGIEYFVECVSCGLITKLCNTKEQAVYLWERRV